MGSNTSRLGLYKVNTATDGSDTFNIDTMLNNNWDKIDENVATLDPTTKKIPTTQLADGTTSAKGIVQLNSATNSTSTTQAATPSAVKMAYDKANTAQTDITNHKNDMVSHVTQADKDNWNAKETPNGAQTKADTAKQAAIDWAKGLGFGETAKVISGSTDLNTMKTSGFYGLSSVTNGPAGQSGSLLVLVIAYNTSYVRQLAFDLDNNAQMYWRTCNNGSWTSWEQFESVVGSQAKADAAETNAKNASIPITQKNAANGVAPTDGNNKVPIANLPDATTAAKGVTQLNNTVTSTSTTQAATANAVKTAYDKAATAQSEIDAHANRTDNPHNVTSQQVNYLPQYTKSAADLPTTYPMGVSVTFVRETEGWFSYGQIVTFRPYSNDGSVLQYYIPYDSNYGGTALKMRFGKYSGGWTEWKEVETTTGAQAKADAAETNAKNASIPLTQKNAANGVAPTDSSNKVPVANLPDGTTSAKGVVQLNSATNSTSTTQAATPSAVKAAYDKANTAQSEIDTHEANTVIHVTQSDKDNWNAKETPSGAQAKANAAETNAINFAKTNNMVYIKDTRSVNSLPSDYVPTANDRGLYVEFKYLSTVGITGVSGTYCTVITDSRWLGSSGGDKSQLAFTDENRIFTRTSTSETTWGPWKELETTVGAQAKVDAHAGDATAHITATERSTWNAKASTSVVTTSANGLMSSTDKTKLDGISSGAEVNQNAFSNIKVGSNTIAADSKTDTLELVAGTNITLTPDATNGKVTIATMSGLETTSGAQAKADAAEANAKNASIPLAQKGAADGVATLDSNGGLVQKPYVTGSYVGNGGLQYIPLPFRPSAVFVKSRYEYKDTTYQWEGFALENSSAVSVGSTNNVGLSVVASYDSNPNQFWVSNSYNSRLNNSGDKYHYIAYR
jgi:hypothetical protein